MQVERDKQSIQMKILKACEVQRETSVRLDEVTLLQVSEGAYLWFAVRSCVSRSGCLLLSEPRMLVVVSACDCARARVCV